MKESRSPCDQHRMRGAQKRSSRRRRCQCHTTCGSQVNLSERELYVYRNAERVATHPGGGGEREMANEVAIELARQVMEGSGAGKHEQW